MRCLSCFLTLMVFSLALLARPALAGEVKPVWLVSNGFHTSIAVRARDVPFRREVSGDRRADELLIGWGASDWYRGKVNPWIVAKTLLWPNPSVLHVVSIRGSVAARFDHSDIIRLALSAPQFHALLQQLDEAFALDSRGRRIFLSDGYYPESRFYKGTESFYFPKMCNVWVAQKLRRSGVPISLLTSIAASELCWHAEKIGQRERWHRLPVDAF